MALNELQWGRILALTWLDKPFKDKFETNPAQAFEDLKKRKAELCEKYGDFILEELGLEGDNISLIDLETMTWDGVDFAGLPGAQLQKCIEEGDEQIGPPSSPWFWGTDKTAVPLTADTHDGGNRVLTAKEWGRIYARIWMDHRLDEFDMDPQMKKDYGPKNGYLEQFEKDPANVVEKIAAALKIEFTLGQTRLFAVLEKPQDWAPTELSDLVKTGRIENQPLVWVVNKTC